MNLIFDIWRAYGNYYITRREIRAKTPMSFKPKLQCHSNFATHFVLMSALLRIKRLRMFHFRWPLTLSILDWPKLPPLLFYSVKQQPILLFQTPDDYTHQNSFSFPTYPFLPKLPNFTCQGGASKWECLIINRLIKFNVMQASKVFFFLRSPHLETVIKIYIITWHPIIQSAHVGQFINMYAYNI